MTRPMPKAKGQPHRRERPRQARIRADLLLVERGLAESRERAQALIIEGLVYVPGGRVLKPGSLLANDAVLE